MSIYLSGMQTSGILHLGNYLGAIKLWKQKISQSNIDDDSFFFMFADLHSLTTQKNSKKLQDNIIDCVAMYLACGLNDHSNVNLFLQSSIPQHSELCWILSNHINIGQLFRMTQFKDKKQKNKSETNINSSLLFYPVLMAADILLYNADFVPVGADQKQHVELARDIAIKFNNLYGNVFKIPNIQIQKNLKKVMSLKDGSKKMSKSDPSDLSRINLSDSKDQIAKKINSATTDSISGIYYDEKDRPEISNLITIASIILEESIKKTESRFVNSTTKEFKSQLIEILEMELSPIRNSFVDYKKSGHEILSYTKKGHDFASQVAINSILNIKKSIGLIDF